MTRYVLVIDIDDVHPAAPIGKTQAVAACKTAAKELHDTNAGPILKKLAAALAAAQPVTERTTP